MDSARGPGLAAAGRRVADPIEQHSGRGFTARELIRRSGHAGKINARELERWLLDEELATNGDGRLRPTRRALELADGLTFLG